MADGSIVIDTKIDNKGLYKDVNSTKKGLEGLKNTFSSVGSSISDAFGGKSQSKIDSLTSKYERQTEILSKQKTAIDELQLKYNQILSGEARPKQLIEMERELVKNQKEAEKLEVRMRQIQEILNAKGIEFGVNTSEIQVLNSELETLNEKSAILNTRADELQGNIGKIKLEPQNSIEAQKLATEIELGDKKTQRLNSELEKTEKQIKKASSSNLTSNMDNGFKGLIKSAVKFGLALFSIRTIYSMLSRLGGEYLRQNEQLSANLNYVKSALANAFGPVVDFLINGFIKVLSYVGAIIKILTGVNIFAGSYSKHMANSAKSAKQVQKAMHSTSIDELNVINEQEKSGSGGRRDNSTKY